MAVLYFFCSNVCICQHHKTKKRNDLNENSEKSHRDSVRAITLIRAYRTQGNLLANLDPLGIKTSEYIDELHPEYHGFKKEDYEKKIFLDGIINKDYANIREILGFSTKRTVKDAVADLKKAFEKI